MKYYWLRYTDDSSVQAYAKGCVITVNNKYRNDKALLAHEKTHVRQWWLMTIPLFIVFIALIPYMNDLAFVLGFPVVVMGHNLLYTVSKKYRLHCELQAYKHQLAMNNNIGIYNAAKALADDYDLDIDFDTALKLLRKRTKQAIP